MERVDSTSIGAYGLATTNDVTKAYMPNVITMGTHCYTAWPKKLILPKLKVVPDLGYAGTRTLLDLTDVESFTRASFNGTTLTSLVLRGYTIPTIETLYWSGGISYIYVPSALIEEYKVATNWTVYADQFRALEDYTVDGTITGELDESKI